MDKNEIVIEFNSLSLMVKFEHDKIPENIPEWVSTNKQTDDPYEFMAKHCKSPVAMMGTILKI